MSSLLNRNGPEKALLVGHAYSIRHLSMLSPPTPVCLEGHTFSDKHTHFYGIYCYKDIGHTSQSNLKENNILFNEII
jgi:hypothetical protein